MAQLWLTASIIAHWLSASRFAGRFIGVVRKISGPKHHLITVGLILKVILQLFWIVAMWVVRYKWYAVRIGTTLIALWALSAVRQAVDAILSWMMSVHNRRCGPYAWYKIRSLSLTAGQGLMALMGVVVTLTSYWRRINNVIWIRSPDLAAYSMNDIHLCESRPKTSSIAIRFPEILHFQK